MCVCDWWWQRHNCQMQQSLPLLHFIFGTAKSLSLASREPEGFGCGFHVQAIAAAIHLSKRAFSVFKHLQLFQPIISHKPVISPAAACLPRKTGSSVDCFLAAQRATQGLMLLHQRLAALASRLRLRVSEFRRCKSELCVFKMVKRDYLWAA